jgi:Lon protease-like protein
MGQAPSFHKIEDLPTRIAIFPLSRAILLPRGQLPLNIFEPRYLALVDDALGGDRLIGMIQPKRPENETPAPPLFDVGGLGRITAFADVGDGRYRITLTGLCRFAIAEELAGTTPYRQVRADYTRFGGDLDAERRSHAADPSGRGELLSTLKIYLERNSLAADWESIERAPDETLVNALSMISPFSVQEKQALLESPTVEERRKVLTALIEMALAEPSEGDGGPVQ